MHVVHVRTSNVGMEKLQKPELGWRVSIPAFHCILCTCNTSITGMGNSISLRGRRCGSSRRALTSKMKTGWERLSRRYSSNKCSLQHVI